MSHLRNLIKEEEKGKKTMTHISILTFSFPYFSEKQFPSFLLEKIIRQFNVEICALNV